MGDGGCLSRLQGIWASECHKPRCSDEVSALKGHNSGWCWAREDTEHSGCERWRVERARQDDLDVDIDVDVHSSGLVPVRSAKDRVQRLSSN